MDPINNLNGFSLSSLLYISNWTNADFVAKWNGAEYLLPANKMTPVVVGTPQQNQEIRKLWALKLCERELQKDKKFAKALPTKIDFEPLMAKCLSPLEKGEPISKPAAKTEREKERIMNVESVFKTEDAVNAAMGSSSAPQAPAFNA